MSYSLSNISRLMAFCVDHTTASLVFASLEILLMTRNLIPTLALFITVATSAAGVHAAPPFAEDFTGGTANWRFSTAIDLTAVGSGGPDSSPYVSRTFSFSSLTNPNATSAIIFRAQDEFNSSGVAYAGNWPALGVDEVSVYVRHSAPEPLVYNARFANPANFPGASYFSAPVPANVWTQLTFDVTPSSPQLADPTYEGTNSYAAVMSNIGHMQFGVNIPQSLVGSTTAYTFDLDAVRVNVVPEPATAGLLAVAGGALALVVRRRR
jgi:hypothetical protein